MITAVDDYFAQGCGRCERFATSDCSTRHWAEGLQALRALCLGEGLQEVAKWGHPCYRHAGRNVAILGAFRQDFRLSFFHAALLSNAAGLLERQGPATQHADALRFTRASQVAERADAVRACLREAMDHAEAGRLPPKEATALVLPEELAEALAADAEWRAAFDALTPGRQRGYVLRINAAKKPETRVARVLGFRERMLAGKGVQER